MSQKDKDHYAKVKSDPVKYSAYLERKRQERQARGVDSDYETVRKREWRLAHPETAESHRKANHAVDAAIKIGLLVRTRFCSNCGKEGETEAHHRSYAPEHRLAVLWLCQACHSAEHYSERIVSEA